MEDFYIDTLPFEKQDHVKKMSQFTRKMDKEDRERDYDEDGEEDA